jgi:hypothetical protein
MAALAIPEALQPYAGRIIDVDTHEMIPSQLWRQEFGAVTDEFTAAFQQYAPDDPSGANFPDYRVDDAPITDETIWNMKGPTAPGAVDPSRRLEIMDRTGVSRQMMFPSAVAIFGSLLFDLPPEYGFLPHFKGDRKAYGRALFEANNNWAIRAAKVSSRIRPVPIVYGETVDELVTTTRHLIDSGIRAIFIVSSVLPAGRSPAHSDLDPFWQLITERDVTATVHIGSEGGFLKTQAWGDAPAFEGYRSTVEVNLSPWHLSTLHLASQNFLATMVLGGVFDRHPTLRFGAIELGSFWIGPLANQLDMWCAHNYLFSKTKAVPLSMKPSEFIRRNVRVTAFDFEPVDEYIGRYGLEDVYCYASDFPHIEGGKDLMGRFARRLEKLGPNVMEKFFVKNGEWLLPA